MADVANGFWGKATSNVDWCENNYVHSYYVAEWFNTLSSVPVALFALHGLLHCWRSGFEARQLLVHSCFILVGLGSCCFHGTLTWQGQAADELPMILGSSVFLYTALHLRRDTPSMPILLFLLAFDVVATVVYFIGHFLVFFFLYSLLACPVMYLSVQHARLPNVSQRTRVIGILSVALYLGGFIVFWLPEKYACGNRLEDHYPTIFQSLQFHALFHTTSAFGTYLWSVFICLARMEWMAENRRGAFETRYAHLVPTAADAQTASTAERLSWWPTTIGLSGPCSVGLPLPVAVVLPKGGRQRNQYFSIL